jgi:hypothetical protein
VKGSKMGADTRELERKLAGIRLKKILRQGDKRKAEKDLDDLYEQELAIKAKIEGIRKNEN